MMNVGLREFAERFFLHEAAKRPPIGTDEFETLAVSGAAFQLRTAPPALRQAADFKAAVLVVRAGSLEATIAPAFYALNAGDVFVACNIDFELVARERAEFDVFLCPAWWSARELFSPDEDSLNLKIPGTFFSASIIRDLVAKMRAGAVLPESMHDAAGMLASLVRQSLAMNHGESTLPTMLPIGRGRFGRITRFVGIHAAQDDVSPQMVADYLRCSVRTIHQTCAQNGTTFNQIVMDFRLMLAAYWLRHTTRRVSDVAYACGFRSLSHFCRLFKERYGVVAGKFRDHWLANGRSPPPQA